MRLLAVTGLAVLAVAAPAAAQDQPACAGADAPVVRDPTSARAAILCIVNAERMARGLFALSTDARLDAAAQGHSDDMAARGYFEHVSPDGESPADRASRAGYPYASLHENIAVGQSTAREVMEGWMRSPSHCSAVLAPEVIHLGIGIAPRSAQGPYWTQELGLPQGSAPPSQDTAPQSGCPYQELSIRPGPADLGLLALGRRGRRVTVVGLLDGEGAGRQIVVEARRRGRARRKVVRTFADGTFRTTIRAPRGRGSVRITVMAPRVDGAYETGSNAGRV